MRKLSLTFTVLIAVVLVLTACNMPVGNQGPTQSAGVVQTAAAQTVQALQTQIAAVTPVPTLEGQPTQELPTESAPPTAAVTTNTPVPSLTPSSGNNNSPTQAAAVPCDRGSFVEDVTVPDGKSYDANATFTKTWRLKNNGTCTWGTGYKVVFDSGDAMGGPASIDLPSSVAPGKTIDLSVTLTAPKTPKTYQGNWKLQNASGKVFGIGSKADQPFWVKIVVGGGTPAASYFAVTSVQVSAQPATYNDVCPVTLKLGAKIATNKEGTVTYYWERNDNFRTPRRRLEFDKGGSKSVTEEVGMDASFEGTWRIYVDDPNHQFFGPVSVKIECN